MSDQFNSQPGGVQYILTRILSQVQAEVTELVVVAAVPISVALLLFAFFSLPDSHLLRLWGKHARLDWTRLHPFEPVTFLDDAVPHVSS